MCELMNLTEENGNCKVFTMVHVYSHIYSLQINSLAIYGRDPQGLGATEFRNLIG